MRGAYLPGGFVVDEVEPAAQEHGEAPAEEDELGAFLAHPLEQHDAVDALLFGHVLADVVFGQNADHRDDAVLRAAVVHVQRAQHHALGQRVDDREGAVGEVHAELLDQRQADFLDAAVQLLRDLLQAVRLLVVDLQLQPALAVLFLHHHRARQQHLEQRLQVALAHHLPVGLEGRSRHLLQVARGARAVQASVSEVDLQPQGPVERQDAGLADEDRVPLEVAQREAQVQREVVFDEQPEHQRRLVHHEGQLVRQDHGQLLADLLLLRLLR